MGDHCFRNTIDPTRHDSFLTTQTLSLPLLSWCHVIYIYLCQIMCGGGKYSVMETILFPNSRYKFSNLIKIYRRVQCNKFIMRN